MNRAYLLIPGGNLKAAGHNLIKAKDNAPTELTRLNRAVLQWELLFYLLFFFFFIMVKNLILRH